MVDAPVGRPLPRRPNLVTLTVGPAASQCSVTPTQQPMPARPPGDAHASGGCSVSVRNPPRQPAREPPPTARPRRRRPAFSRRQLSPRASPARDPLTRAIRLGRRGRPRRSSWHRLVTSSWRPPAPSKLSARRAAAPDRDRAEIGGRGRCLGWCGPAAIIVREGEDRQPSGGGRHPVAEGHTWQLTKQPKHCHLSTEAPMRGISRSTT